MDKSFRVPLKTWKEQCREARFVGASILLQIVTTILSTPHKQLSKSQKMINCNALKLFAKLKMP